MRSETTETVENVPFESIERNLRQLRDKAFPKSPQTADELKTVFENENMMNIYGMCNQTEDQKEKKDVFYRGVVKGNGFSSVVFASPSMIEMIKENIPHTKRYYFVDGTFKIVPIGYYSQLLIIHVCYLDVVC